jgi:CTP:phosphocholine cytidylyltransferase-like protein
MDTEVEDRVEEDLDEAKIQLCSTAANNRYIMKGSVHFHQQHVCTIMQQTMTQKIVQHSWERSKKKRTKTTRMSSGSLQMPWIIGETSI